jgi:hypothetical protein
MTSWSGRHKKASVNKQQSVSMLRVSGRLLNVPLGLGMDEYHRAWIRGKTVADPRGRDDDRCSVPVGKGRTRERVVFPASGL